MEKLNDTKRYLSAKLNKIDKPLIRLVGKETNS